MFTVYPQKLLNTAITLEIISNPVAFDRAYLFANEDICLKRNLKKIRSRVACSVFHALKPIIVTLFYCSFFLFFFLT